MTKRNAKGRWLPGSSANPGGRPKGREEFTALARQFAPEALDRLVHWLRSNREGASVAAARMILERAWGRPPSTEEAAALVVADAKGDQPRTMKIQFVLPSRRSEEVE